MVRKTAWVVVAVMVMVLVASLVYAQGGRRGMRRGAEGMEARGSQRGAPPTAPGARRQEMMEQMLDQMNLTAAEKTAAQDAIRKKQASQQELGAAMGSLYKMANDPKVTEAQLRSMVSDYLKARDRAMKTTSDIDRSLMKQLSPRAQAKLLSVGFIDNGLNRGGIGMGMGPAGGGGMRRGGTSDNGGGGRGIRRGMPPEMVAPAR